MLKESKLLTLRGLKKAGLFTFFKNSDWRRRRLLILAYHGISIDDEHLWNPALFMSSDDFADRLRLIKEFNCTVLPLNEALTRMFANDLPERSVALTFDDGTYDFYKMAHPLIKGFSFPVTLYLTTFYSYYPKPVFDVMCSYLIWKGRGSKLDLKDLTGQHLALELSEPSRRAVALTTIQDYVQLNHLSAEEKDSLLARLASQLHVDYDDLLSKRILQIMSPDEARQLASEGVDIQLHTHRHRTPLDRTKFLREIVDNQNSILSMTGSVAKHFCYPSGVYDDAFFTWLEEAGVTSATTCTPDLAKQTSDPLLLPRLIDSPNLSPLEFEGWLAGVSSLLPQKEAPKKVAPRVLRK